MANSRSGRWAAAGLIASACTLACAPAAAAANDAPLPEEAVLHEPLIEVSEVEFAAADDAPAARITFGRAVDVDGRTMYARRGQFAETSGVVVFSRTPPPVAATRAAGAGRLGAPLAAGATGPLPRFLPVTARAITSTFGSRRHPILGVQRNHLGVDLAVASGTPVAATAEGTVSFAGWSGGYGMLVAVDHGGGVQTRYAHMSRIAVSPGQRVHAGDVLGAAGSTGLSTGPHVHYEVRVNGRAVSPLGR